MPLESSRRFEALKSGSIDVLSRNTTWTMSREIELGLAFTATNYYDGQGFLVRRTMNKETALDLDGAKVCVQTGTTTELNLVDYFRANKMKYEMMTSPSAEGAIKGYDSGQCSVFTADVSQLFADQAFAVEARRPRHSAGCHLQGAAWPGGAPGRYAMV